MKYLVLACLPPLYEEIVLYRQLEGHHIPIGYFSMSKGDKGEVMCDFNYLFQLLLLTGAESFIYAHNHPKGAYRPSEQDIKFTTTLKRLADY